MKTLLKWIRTYPVSATVLAWNFGALSVLAGSRPDLLPITVSLFFLLLAGWMVHAWWDSKRIIVVLLLLAIGTPSRAAEEDNLEAAGGGIILGATVIVIGGIIYFGLRRICQKFFPPPPNPPKQTPHKDEDDGEASAEPPPSVAMSYADPAIDYCIEAASSVQPTGVELTIVADATPRIESIRLTSLLTREDYVAALQPHGIGLTTQITCSSNGVPAESIGVSVQFGQVVVGDGAMAVTIEASQDLKWWEPIYSARVPAGARMVVSEAVHGVGFYRVVAQ